MSNPEVKLTFQCLLFGHQRPHLKHSEIASTVIFLVKKLDSNRWFHPLKACLETTLMNGHHIFTLLPAKSDCLLVMVFDRTERNEFANDLHTLHASLGANKTINGIAHSS